MASLKDTMLGIQPTQPKADLGGNVENLKAKMKALSGKAGSGVGSTTPRASNVQEASQLALAQAQRGQLAQSAQVAQLGIEQASAQQQQQFQGQMQDLNEKRLNFRQESQLKTNQLLADVDEARLRQGDQQEQVKLELATQQMRLSNDQYIYNLNKAAEEKRINDFYKEQEAIDEAVWGVNFDALQSELNWNELMAADDLTWQKALKNIDIQTAMSVARVEAQANNNAMQWQAAGNLATGIGKGVEANRRYDANNTTTTTNSGTNARAQYDAEYASEGG